MYVRNDVSSFTSMVIGGRGSGVLNDGEGHAGKDNEHKGYARVGRLPFQAPGVEAKKYALTLAAALLSSLPLHSARLRVRRQGGDGIGDADDDKGA